MTDIQFFIGMLMKAPDDFTKETLETAIVIRISGKGVDVYFNFDGSYKTITKK